MAASEAISPDRARVNPAAMSIADLARLLTRVGGEPIGEADIEADVAVGAPTNADGTINLVHYAAWLVRESKDGD